MKVGLYGGSFDPIHIGHLIIASQAKIEHDLDAVWVMPTNDYGYEISGKGSKKPLATAQQRLTMIDLAIGHKINGIFSTSIETLVKGPIRTIDTIRALRKIYPHHDFHWICGGDSYDDIINWEEGEEILTTTRQIVIPRMMFDDNSSFAYGISPQLSSTWVRAQLKKGNDVPYVLPEAVLEYIKTNGLYA